MVPLRQDLIRMLAGHGVAAEEREEAVYLPEVDGWANLWMTRSPEGRSLMELRATCPGGAVVADTWAAIGDDVEAARRDGLTSFSRCGFHVFLAALWGVLETDQVDHEVREVAGVPWDFYLGPYSGRVSSEVEPLAAPPNLVDEVLAAFDASVGPGDTHAMRVYLACMNGVVTTEAIVDGQTAPGVVEAVARAGWVYPPTGFASLRWFVMCRRRGDGPTHHTTRACGAP